MATKTNGLVLRQISVLLCVTVIGIAIATHAQAAPPVIALAFTPDGKQIVCGSQKGAVIYDWPSLREVKRLPAKMLTITTLRFSQDGSRLAVAGGAPGELGVVEVYAWPSLKQLARCTVHDDVVQCIAWLPGGKGAFASASFDGRVLLHRSDGSVTRELHGGATGDSTQPAHSRSVLAVEFLNTDLLASAGVDRSIHIWNACDGKQQRNFENHTGAVRTLSLRPGVEGLPVLASAGADRTVRLWQPTIGRMVRFARLPSAPLAIAWTPGGKRLIAGCEDGKLRVIDPDTVEILSTTEVMQGWVYSIAAQQDSIACGGKSGVRKVKLP